MMNEKGKQRGISKKKRKHERVLQKQQKGEGGAAGGEQKMMFGKTVGRVEFRLSKR